MTDSASRLTKLAARYAVEREIGAGGMATVYLARDQRHGRSVALKVMRSELAAFIGSERFLNEIKTTATLQHPHILPLFDSGEVDGIPFFVMPFVDGESLRDRLERERQLPMEEALEIAKQVASALDYAHRHAIIHRDIKPANILLHDGQALVADFGIARAVSRAHTEPRLTEPGLSLGTPAYMSPEQALGEQQLDGRVDVYALGVVLYEMLAGEPPFPRGVPPLALQAAEAMPDVRRARPGVPESVAKAIQRAIAPLAADRFSTAGQFAAALSPSSSATDARSVVQPGRWSIARYTFPLGVAMAMLVGLLAVWRTRAREFAPEPDVKLIAVLPFENLGSRDDDYFADGVADEVRGKLAEVPGVQVIARASSVTYKRTAKSPDAIARELGVRYLLTATIRQATGLDGQRRVQVSPELAEVIPGRMPRMRWRQSFDAALSDIFRVQTTIAEQVADSLGARLAPTGRQALATRPTNSIDAYDAYLKGETAWDGAADTRPESIRRALRFFEQAVTIDPAFAAAWAQIARAHADYYFNILPTPDRAKNARDAAERALALAPSRPDGHFALGEVYRLVDSDAARALAAFERGLQVAPENALLLASAARAERNLGRWEAALAHLARAQTLDPRSVQTARDLGFALLWNRRYPDATVAYARALALAPTNPVLLEHRVMLELAQGHLDNARAFLRAVPNELPRSDLVTQLAQIFDLYWVLEAPDQTLLMSLGPEHFFDRGSWAMVRAQTYAHRGDGVRSRAYADTARVELEAQVQTVPSDAQRHVLLGLMLAYAGRAVDAVREGERGTALTPITKDADMGAYLAHQLVRIYVLSGRSEQAIDMLEQLLRVPYFVSAAWLQIDPNFDRLRTNPRFQRLTSRR